MNSAFFDGNHPSAQIPQNAEIGGILAMPEQDVAAKERAIQANIGVWYAEAPNAVVGGVEMRIIPRDAVFMSGEARLFTRPDGYTIQLSQHSEPLSGLMMADWLAMDGLTHHAFVLAPNRQGRLQRWFARGEGADRVYQNVPVADGWYAFAVDQSGRVIISGAPAPAAGKATASHRVLLGGLPGLFFGELEIFSGMIVAFNNNAPVYRTAAVLEPQLRELVPALREAKYAPWVRLF